MENTNHRRKILATENDMGVVLILFNNKNMKILTIRNIKRPTRRYHTPTNIPLRTQTFLTMSPHMTIPTQQPT